MFLKANKSTDGEGLMDEAINDTLNVRMATIERVRCCFVEFSLTVDLHR